MTERKIRWGVLGVAKINNRVFPSFARAAHAELYGIASRSLERATEAARAAGAPRAYGSYEELLADPDVDVVYNPLPNNLHAEWTRKAADAGKHVLCEKPLAPTAAEARGMVEHCRAKGVQLMDGFMWPHHPRTARMRQVIDSGELGEVRRVTGAFTFQMEPLDAANIRLRPELGGGSLLDVGCYPVFGIRWAFGAEPTHAFAQARHVNGVDVEMTGQLTFADGRLASFDCGFTLPLRMHLEVTGTKGVLWVPRMWLPEPDAAFVIQREGRPDEVVRVPGADQIAHMLDNFSRAVRDNKPVAQAPEEGVKTLRVLDALARSARGGRPEAVAG